MENFEAIIEIGMNTEPIKYEYSEDGELVVDRFLLVAMRYPCNYGFIPDTLAGDGDPVDVLILSPYSILSGASVECRAVGVLVMEDDGGKDEKILAVPAGNITDMYDSIKDINDVPQYEKDRIAHFFERYKDLEKNKWVKIEGWESREKAEKIIRDAITNIDQ